MEFGRLSSREAIDQRFKQMRMQSRQELLFQIYGKSANTFNEQTIEKQLSQTFCALLQNFQFDKNHAIVRSISQIFRINLQSLRQMQPKQKINLLYEKIYNQIEEATKIIDKAAADKDDRASDKNIVKNTNHFQWLGVNCKYTGLRPIFQEILLEKVKLFDKELTQITEMSSEQAFQSLDMPTTARDGIELRKTQVAPRGKTMATTIRHQRVQSNIESEFTNVKIRDKSQFLLSKWSKAQQDEFQLKKSHFKSNLKINNIPVLFQFVKKYTQTIKARDNIYRKWEERQKLGITPQELRYLCATSVFLNNTLAKSQKQRIKNNIKTAGHSLVSKLQLNIAEKIIETYHQLMKRVADMRAKYYVELTMQRKLQQKQSSSLEQSIKRQKQKQQFFLKYKLMFERVVSGEKMKIRLNTRVFKWVQLFVKRLKLALTRNIRKGASEAVFKRLTTKMGQQTPLYKMKMKYPSSRIIKREDQYSHRLKYRQYMPSERFHYSKKFEDSITAINKTKLIRTHKHTFYKQLTGGPRKQPDYITIDLAKKKVYLSSPCIINMIIKIQAKWKAVFQRKKFKEIIEEVREKQKTQFQQKVAYLYQLYPPDKKIDLKAIEGRLKRMNMKITNIIKPYIRNVRRPLNVFTSFCVNKMNNVDLKNKYSRNGAIRLGEFTKMVENNQFGLLKQSGIVVTSKQINEFSMKNLTCPMWWAVYHSNHQLTSLFLQGGGDPNSKDSQGDTCLHLAIKNGSIPIIFELLDYGGDLNAKNNKKVTALYYATKRMLKLLGLQEGSLFGSAERDNNSLYYRRTNHFENTYNNFLS